MTSFTRKPDGDLAGDPTADQGGRANAVPLEIARRIALETLEADHQALELHRPSSPISLARTNTTRTTAAKQLNGT
jgi:hypothetical protein